MKTLVRAALLMAGLTGTLALGGCVTSQVEDTAGLPVSVAKQPTVVKPDATFSGTLACINRTGVLRGKTFEIGPFVDSTGQANSVNGSGTFLPQAGSATFITAAIRRAGGQVIPAYFGSHGAAQYKLNGVFNSLDRSVDKEMDLRIFGLGPTGRTGWAQLTMSMQLDYASGRNAQISIIQRPVRYTALGAGAGHFFGSVLVTGNVNVVNQERLQFESLDGPIDLGVISVVFKQFPTARERCGSEVAKYLATS